MIHTKELRAEFLDAIDKRLIQGEKDYGNQSFTSDNLGREVLEEILDVAGWMFVIWVQMRMRLERLEVEAVRYENAELRELRTQLQRAVSLVETLRHDVKDPALSLAARPFLAKWEEMLKPKDPEPAPENKLGPELDLQFERERRRRTGMGPGQ